MQPISDVFLSDSEQFLPNSLLVALSTSTQLNNMQIDVILGANDLEALNDNGRYCTMYKVNLYNYPYSVADGSSTQND